MACAGIISKVGMIFFAIVIGISQGIQPIISFNYGAGNGKRVKETYKKALTAAILISTVSVSFVSNFSERNYLYFRFGKRRIFYFCREIFPYLFVFHLY